MDSKVMRLVDNTTTTAHKTALLDFISNLDTRRNLNWREVFPEIADCF
jgi:hypothetical protein